jgi:hypothetical protein
MAFLTETEGKVLTSIHTKEYRIPISLYHCLTDSILLFVVSLYSDPQLWIVFLKIVFLRVTTF